MFVFINHSKKAIELTDKAASKNISKYLFEAIRDNKWSIGDTIEFSDVYINRYNLRNFVENEHYICNNECAKWFYF